MDQLRRKTEAILAFSKTTGFCLVIYDESNNPAAYVRMHYSGGSTLDTPANTIKANEWTHVVGTYDSKTVKIYLNGEVKAEMNASAAIPANANTFVIGGTQESRD